MTDNPVTCRKCGSPVTARMKFCESCGAKVGTFPTCLRCSAVLAPGVKFCENCGMPVATAAAPLIAAPVPAPAEITAPETPSPEPAPAEKARPPVESKVDMEAETGEEALPASCERTPSVPVKEAIPPEKVKEIPKETVAKKPIPKKTMIIAGIIVIALLGAAVYFFVLPLVTGPAISSPNQQTPTVTTIPFRPSTSPVTPAVTTRDAPVSLTPGPTQVPPSERVIVIDTERDPITSIITVTFRGGDGQYGVSQIVVSLTRSDGTEETKTFRPDTVGSGVTLQGTTRTDRLEVTSYFYAGDHYKIIDQIFEYKKRGG